MNIGWSIPLPGPFRISGTIGGNRGQSTTVQAPTPERSPYIQGLLDEGDRYANLGQRNSLLGHHLTYSTKPGRKGGLWWMVTCECGRMPQKWDKYEPRHPYNGKRVRVFGGQHLAAWGAR